VPQACWVPPTPLGDDAAAPAEVALAMVGAQAPVVLSSFDADGTVADLRGPLLDRLGLTPEAILGHHYADLGLPDAVGTCIARALDGEPCGTDVSLQDRDWAFEVRPVAGGGAVAVFTYDDETVAHDLATRREELEKFAALVELSADFIAMAEPDGTVTYLNAAGRELVGLGSHDEALGRPTDDYFTETGRAKSHEVEEAVRTRGFWQGESELHHFGTGESIPVSVNSFLVASPSTGEPLALATVQRDLRARIAAEHDLGRRLSEQRRLAELSRLAVTEPVHALVDQTVRLLHSRFPGLRCGVMQRSLDRHHLVTVSTTEPEDDGLSTRIDPATVSGAAVTLDRTTTSGDLTSGGGFRPTVEAAGSLSALSSPVPGSDGAWGVVEAVDAEPRDWTGEDIAFVESVASLLGAAVRRSELEDALQHQALHDPLTGLPNRALVLDRIEHALARAHRAGTRLAVLLLDLDDFKVVNDSLGHNTGDQLLVELGIRLTGAVRPGDTVARLGGDEFVVLCEDVRTDDEAAFLAEAVLAACTTDFDLAGRTINFSASVGVAVSAGGAGSTTGILGEADIAMYRAKRDRPGTYRIFDEAMRGEVVGRLNTAGELRSALRGKGLDIAYQPIISLATGRITALEALARWTTPSGTAVSPEVFIPVAEETGLIGELGSQILRKAALDAATWQGIAPTGVRVNVSGHEIRSRTFYEDVMRTLEFAELDPALLGLEITESVLVEEGHGTEAVLTRLRDAGVTLMLDDFGTGYSSLSYLQRFPVVDMLKIDRSFLTDEQKGEAVIQAVIGLGRAFDMKVCAEGVENATQHGRVAALGCDHAQGYYFARPIAGDMVPKMLETWAPFMPA
jgi:diguanylate cyclase (GGDEF)-like protein/PAS domain S-box-containing protein